jgi:hypothetical protein
MCFVFSPRISFLMIYHPLPPLLSQMPGKKISNPNYSKTLRGESLYALNNTMLMTQAGDDLPA